MKTASRICDVLFVVIVVGFTFTHQALCKQHPLISLTVVLMMSLCYFVGGAGGVLFGLAQEDSLSR